MKTSGNTIFISGGTAGIGFAMAKLFSKDNKVIITGRDETRLEKALAQLPGVAGIRSDIADNDQAVSLSQKLSKEFPQLNIVINNAGRAAVHNLSETGKAYQIAKDEMDTNFLAVVRFNDLILPLLKKQTTAAIVNVSSVVAFAAAASLPTYAASKSALHAYSQVLRHSISATSVKVFELMPPLVNTEFSKEIGGENGIAPELVAQHLADSLASDNFEIHSGDTAGIYQLFLGDPQRAFLAMNQTREVVA